MTKKQAAGTGVSTKMNTLSLVSDSAASRIASSRVPTSLATEPTSDIEGLAELLSGCNLYSQLHVADSWCSEMGFDSVSEVQEAGCSEQLAAALMLKPGKAKLLKARLEGVAQVGAPMSLHHEVEELRRQLAELREASHMVSRLPATNTLVSDDESSEEEYVMRHGL